MSDEPEDRQRGRAEENRRAIRTIQQKIQDHLAKADPEHFDIYMHLSAILSIINSEYGTIYRIMDRQDEAAKQRQLTHEKLFGKGLGDENCLAAQVAQTTAIVRSLKRIAMAVACAMAVLMATKWYEQTKLNEIIAQQKISNANQPTPTKVP